MPIIQCAYIEDHEHRFPDDWVLGGADGTHPAADPRWRSTVYTYYTEQMKELLVTVAPTCDEMALDNFTFVASLGGLYVPYYLVAKRPGEKKQEVIPWTYRKSNDSIYPLGG